MRDPSNPSPRECAIVALACAASLAVNLATATRFPIPWLDEVMFTDPAANLLLGNGFTSCAWPQQACGTFWAGYPPLYPALLFAWMRVFGFGPLAVRALDYVLVVLAVVMLWLAVARLRLVAEPRARLWLVALLFLGYGMTFCYRSARVDCAGIAVATAIALAASITDARRRCAAIALLTALLPLIGLQLLVYAVLIGAVFAALHGRTLHRELASGAAGLLAGTAVLYALYAAHGAWPTFVRSTVDARSLAGRGFSAAGIAATLRQYDRSFGGVYKDPSFLVLLAVASMLAVLRRTRRQPVLRSPLGFALAAALVVPGALFLSGVYPVYYAWMAYLPLSVGACAALSDGRATMPRLASAGLALACAVGLPLILAWTAADWRDRDYRRVEVALRDAVTADDHVYIDYPAYYVVKPRAAAVFTDRSLPHMSRTDADSVDVLIVAPEQLEAATRALGGSWRATGTAVRSRPGRDARVSIWGPRYDLAVYRRARD